MDIKLLRKSDEGFERFDLLGDITANGRMQQPADLFLNVYGEDIYKQRVMVNMAKTTHVDSTGIEWLLNCHKRFQEQGGKLVLHNLSPATQKLFQMMRMHLVLNIASDENSAKSLFV